MKRSLVMLCLLLAGNGAAAGSASFEDSLFGVTEISHFHTDPGKLGLLTPEARSDVLAAKSTLVNVLRALEQKDGNPLPYLGDDLRKRYPSRLKLAQFLVDEETSLLALLVDDFTVSTDGAQIDLQITVVVDAEGSVTGVEKSAVLQKVGHDWRLSAIK